MNTHSPVCPKCGTALVRVDVDGFDWLICQNRLCGYSRPVGFEVGGSWSIIATIILAVLVVGTVTILFLRSRGY